jgi:hypothetical protein
MYIARDRVDAVEAVESWEDALDRTFTSGVDNRASSILLWDF